MGPQPRSAQGLFSKWYRKPVTQANSYWREYRDVLDRDAYNDARKCRARHDQQKKIRPAQGRRADRGSHAGSCARRTGTRAAMRSGNRDCSTVPIVHSTRNSPADLAASVAQNSGRAGGLRPTAAAQPPVAEAAGAVRQYSGRSGLVSRKISRIAWRSAADRCENSFDESSPDST